MSEKNEEHARIKAVLVGITRHHLVLDIGSQDLEVPAMNNGVDMDAAKAFKKVVIVTLNKEGFAYKVEQPAVPASSPPKK